MKLAVLGSERIMQPKLRDFLLLAPVIVTLDSDPDRGGQEELKELIEELTKRSRERAQGIWTKLCAADVSACTRVYLAKHFSVHQSVSRQ